MKRNKNLKISEIYAEMPRYTVKKVSHVSYHDPYCPEIRQDGHTPIQNLPMHSHPLTKDSVAEADLVLIVTDHLTVDYTLVQQYSKAIVDTRGVII